MPLVQRPRGQHSIAQPGIELLGLGLQVLRHTMAVRSDPSQPNVLQSDCDPDPPRSLHPLPERFKFPRADLGSACTAHENGQSR